MTFAAQIALAAYWMAWLGVAPLFDVDEGAFAEASREMLASGDWGHTTLNGIDRFDKPILVYWLQAASIGVFGANEWAVRLPSALCAFGWALATGRFAAQRWGPRIGLLAAVILSSSLGPLAIGRASTADALLNLLLALAAFDLWRYLERTAPTGGAPDRHGATLALRRMALWIALGVLAKGPVAIVVPAGAAIGWALLRRVVAREDAWRSVLGILRSPSAWAIGVAVAVPWYGYAWWRHGDAFVQGFLVRHNLQRFSGPLEGHGGSVLYYALLLPVLMLPWTPMLVPVVRRLRETATDRTSGFLLAWAVFVLALFSLSGTKLPHYALYGYTPIALLAARELGRGAAPRSAVWVVVGAAVVVAFGAVSPWVAAWAGARQRDAHWGVLLDASTLPQAPAWGWTALAAAVIVVLGAWGLRHPSVRARAAAASALAAGVWVSSSVAPWWGRALQEPVKALAVEARSRGLPVVQWGLHQPSLAYYLDRPAPQRAPREGEAALVRTDRLDALNREAGLSARPVATIRGYALVVP
jgi:4-amino-4-deoxy-L-arabinose transferase-like glycosyltransferase